MSYDDETKTIAEQQRNKEKAVTGSTLSAIEELAEKLGTLRVIRPGLANAIGQVLATLSDLHTAVRQ